MNDRTAKKLVNLHKVLAICLCKLNRCRRPEVHLFEPDARFKWPPTVTVPSLILDSVRNSKVTA
jgi:hypothetical protein